MCAEAGYTPVKPEPSKIKHFKRRHYETLVQMLLHLQTKLHLKSCHLLSAVHDLQEALLGVLKPLV